MSASGLSPAHLRLLKLLARQAAAAYLTSVRQPDQGHAQQRTERVPLPLQRRSG